MERVKVHRRSRKLDWEALRKQVEQKPDALLLERAAEYWYNQCPVF
ncbi:IS630 transposase-related protein [Roseofilum sp. SID3]